MLGDDLRVALGAALERAREKRHEFLTLEHMLHGLLHDPRASEVLEACGANLLSLEKELEDFLDGMETLDIEGDYDPIQTLGTLLDLISSRLDGLGSARELAESRQITLISPETSGS